MTVERSPAGPALTLATPAVPLLAVRDVSMTLPTPAGPLHAVDRVSFTLTAGQAVGIVGESGSGKSMLARTALGLAPASARTTGSVRFAGRELLGASARDLRPELGPGIAMVFQDPSTALNPVLRIGRQLAETLRLRGGLKRRAARERAVELLRDVGIDEPERRARSYPHELSGGMRQRVCIALAVACDPRVLLADEPTTALDVTVQRQILDLLADLRARRGLGLVLITHDLAVAAGRTDHLLVMYAGQVVESGPTAQVIRAARHPYTAALLASVPRLDQPSHTRLATVPGTPATPVGSARGCRFAPRCSRVLTHCRQREPVLADPWSHQPVGPRHAVACFAPVGAAPGPGRGPGRLDGANGEDGEDGGP